MSGIIGDKFSLNMVKGAIRATLEDEAPEEVIERTLEVIDATAKNEELDDNVNQRLLYSMGIGFAAGMQAKRPPKGCEGYTRCVSYYFEAGGEGYELTPHAGSSDADISETRKNGQEDTHFTACVIRVGDEYDFDSEGRHYEGYGHDYDAILAHINKHSVPKEG